MSATIRHGAPFAACLAALLAFAAADARAVCIPELPQYRYVGDTSLDAQCTDNDIQSAIDNACPNSTIMISRQHTYTAQHLHIDGKTLVLTGTGNGVGCGPPGACDPGVGCTPPPTAPVVTLSGEGHSGDSVLYISGNSNVTLRFLEIRNGSNVTGYGGGIHFDGKGSLTLDTTTVSNNVAGFGGGINFNGSGGFAGLALLGRTLVINNTAANSGGGIRISGQSYMSILYDNTLVALNHAPNGYGGGVNVVGPAHADIASPGLGSLGVIYSNDALHGGGMAVTAGSSIDDDAEVQLFTVDPARPVRVHDNFASQNGGAIYTKGYIGFPAFNSAMVCARDFRLDDNAAPDGSAAFLDYDTDNITDEGSTLTFNQPSYCIGLPPSAQRCAAGVPCNTVNGNVAVDAGGNPTLGATIKIEDESFFMGNRFTMQDNHGGYAIRASSHVMASNCLLTDNNVTRQLLNSTSGALEFSNCTFASNTILSTDTIHAEGPLTLANSILDQPGNLALAYSGNASDLHVDYVLSSDVSTLPPVEGVAVGVPTYVNAAGRDYRLQLGSIGIDYAPPISGDDRDLDGLPHDQDLPQAGNLWGVRDLGAYERQRTFACGAGTGETIFCDGFEVP
jgi:predicted outer membrane repeat protein